MHELMLFVGRGEPYSELLSELLNNLEKTALKQLSSDCKQERILSGKSRCKIIITIFSRLQASSLSSLLLLLLLL